MRYAKYKKTGIAWLPEVPDGWEVVSFGRMLETPLTYGASESGEVEYAPGMVRYIRITDITLDGKLKDDGCKYLAFENAKGVMLAKGDVLFARSGATVGKTYLFDEDFPACYAGYLIRASVDRRKLLPNFLIYFTQSYQYNEWKNRIFIQSTIQNISAAKYGKLPIILPPLSEQRVIAGYLDEKCGKVDALVAAKERQVELLKEMKQSMIADAVTKGVNVANVEMLPISNTNTNWELETGIGNNGNTGNIPHNRPLKPSGIPWLPEVPEGWEVRRLKSLFTQRHEGYSSKENLQVLSLLKDVGVIPYDEKGNIGNKSKDDVSGYNVARKGDIVMNSMNVIIGSVDITDYDGYISPAYYAITAKEGVEAKYYNYLFHLRAVQKHMRSLAKGIMEIRLRISTTSLFSMQFPLPPLAEQKAIVAHIEERAAKIDATISGLQKEISLLKEYRERLIADVVTGQRRVNSSTNRVVGAVDRSVDNSSTNRVVGAVDRSSTNSADNSSTDRVVGAVDRSSTNRADNSSTNRAVGAVDGSSTNRVVGAAANNGGAAISAATKKGTAKGVAR